MAVNAAVNICAVHADVIFARAPVAPPLSGSKETDNRSTSGNRDVRRASVAANIDLCAFSQRIKTFQRKTYRSRFARLARAKNPFRQFGFAWPVSN